jgi:hypothetical protein
MFVLVMGKSIRIAESNVKFSIRCFSKTCVLLPNCRRLVIAWPSGMPMNELTISIRPHAQVKLVPNNFYYFFARN